MDTPPWSGLDAAAALAAGRAAVVPNPSPQTYGVVATVPHAVNAAKGRPLDQEVAVALHDETERRALLPSLALDPAAVARARTLIRAERVSLLAPLNGHPPPEWITPAVRDGHVAFFGADLSRCGPG